MSRDPIYNRGGLIPINTSTNVEFTLTGGGREVVVYQGNFIECSYPLPLNQYKLDARTKLKEMTMKYVDIRVWFKEEVEEWDDESYVHLDACKVEPVGNNFDPGQGYQVAEAAGQSDFYQIAVSNAFLAALDGETVTDLSSSSG